MNIGPDQSNFDPFANSIHSSLKGFSRYGCRERLNGRGEKGTE